MARRLPGRACRSCSSSAVLFLRLHAGDALHGTGVFNAPPKTKLVWCTQLNRCCCALRLSFAEVFLAKGSGHQPLRRRSNAQPYTPFVAARMLEALCSTSAGMYALKATGVESRISSAQSLVLQKARDAVGCGADVRAQAAEHLAGCGVSILLPGKDAYELLRTPTALEALLKKGARRSCLKDLW